MERGRRSSADRTQNVPRVDRALGTGLSGVVAGSYFGVDLDDVVFGVGEEQRAVPKELQVFHCLEDFDTVLSELGRCHLDGVWRHSEGELNRGCAGFRSGAVVGAATKAQRDQGGASLEFDLSLGDLVANLQPHDLGVEAAHHLDVVAEQNGVIEVADGPEAADVVHEYSGKVAAGASQCEIDPTHRTVRRRVTGLPNSTSAPTHDSGHQSVDDVEGVSQCLV